MLPGSGMWTDAPFKGVQWNGQPIRVYKQWVYELQFGASRRGWREEPERREAQVIAL
jgi:hypothetical protein